LDIVDVPHEEAIEERHREELEEAYRRGVDDGRRTARAQARRELASAMGVALKVMDEIKSGRAMWMSTVKENLVTLAAGIARQIVDRELSLDPTIFVETAKKAISAFPVDEPLRVRVHPEDLAMLEEADALSPDDLKGDRAVRWVLDEAMARGGCVVEGPDRIVDGRVDEALVRVVRTLTHA
jgi:flagellar biosynthesis/type III secretory pathway protein FliH